MVLDTVDIHLASRNLMLAGFAMAALANAWRRNWVYVVALVLAFVETYKRLRFGFHNWVRVELVGVHPQGGSKEILQSKLIYAGSMALCIVLILLIPYLVRANVGRRLMVLGSLMATTVLALELISPHHIDRIIYHPIVIFAISAIIYFVSGLLMAFGALIDRRR